MRKYNNQITVDDVMLKMLSSNNGKRKFIIIVYIVYLNATKEFMVMNSKLNIL